MWGPYSGATAIQLKIFRVETNLIFENRHADNSSGGVSLCQSVALDVEDLGNGALETECEVAKTVGGNS